MPLLHAMEKGHWTAIQKYESILAISEVGGAKSGPGINSVKIMFKSMIRLRVQSIFNAPLHISQ